MARLRAPDGCPWDRDQDHMTLRWHAVEEVYELMDAIESHDDHELEEELGDLTAASCISLPAGQKNGVLSTSKKSLDTSQTNSFAGHPHVFGDTKVKDVDQVWANWEKIKRAEKHGNPSFATVGPGRHTEAPARTALRGEASQKKRSAPS